MVGITGVRGRGSGIEGKTFCGVRVRFVCMIRRYIHGLRMERRREGGWDLREASLKGEDELGNSSVFQSSNLLVILLHSYTLHRPPLSH